MSSATLILGTHSVPLTLDADTLQGSWTEDQYLRLTDQTNRLVEFVDDRLEMVLAQGAIASRTCSYCVMWATLAGTTKAGSEPIM
jgi:hypothetical protein